MVSISHIYIVPAIVVWQVQTLSHTFILPSLVASSFIFGQFPQETCIPISQYTPVHCVPASRIQRPVFDPGTLANTLHCAPSELSECKTSYNIDSKKHLRTPRQKWCSIYVIINLFFFLILIVLRCTPCSSMLIYDAFSWEYSMWIPSRSILSLWGAPGVVDRLR